MNDELRNQVFVAALLHDIGKFYQRASDSLSNRYNSLSPYSPKIAEGVCPIDKEDKFGYQHIVWTNAFLEMANTVIGKVPGLNSIDDSDDSLPSLACNHHTPKTELQALISLADCWSACSDRSNYDTLATKAKYGCDSHKRIPLLSIFNRINGGKYNSAFDLRPLDIKKDRVFPNDTTSSGVSQIEYKKLWDEFYDEFKTLPTDSFAGFTESLTYLLKKYTWCVPTNTLDMVDVSLYEHLKTTAAFADCFYCYREDSPSSFKWDGARLSLAEGTKPVILLGGDISGIQNFIYNVSSKKAAVSLKGRSFYLQLMVDSIIQRIISHPDINATIAQVVYSSGGKFYMLLPNTKKVCNAIDELRKEFAQTLWNEHKGGLLLNIDYVAFAFDCKLKNILFDGAETGAKIGDLWKVLADKLTSCKNTRFKSVIQNNCDELFTPQRVSWDDKVCAVTGVEGKCVNIGDSGEDAVWVLPSVEKQCDLGNVLKDADYIITHTGDSVPKLFKSKWAFDIDIMGVHTYLFDQKELISEGAEFRAISSADVCRVKRINNLLLPQLKGKSCSYGYQFYGGNKQAEITFSDNKTRNKTFEELASGEYLGILRMDVDNLGAIFIKGLPEESKSFAAYSTLSFMLDWFFSGYLNTIRAQEEFKDYVNILYSGGDDVFAIGKWDKIILFAEAVRKAFARFVGRGDISISAGVTIVDAKYPIAKAAQLAGDAEDEAKQFLGEKGLPKKNALNVFGVSVSWEKEYDYVVSYKSRFVQLISGESQMPRSILHRLMTLYQKMEAGDMSYMWHSAYFLKRFSEGKNEKVQNFCTELKRDICERRKFENLAVAARWAELELKFNS